MTEYRARSRMYLLRAKVAVAARVRFSLLTPVGARWPYALRPPKCRNESLVDELQCAPCSRSNFCSEQVLACLRGRVLVFARDHARTYAPV
jgi:hypothetical protein